MPTGSLCSERNAIGTALATNGHIRREHFKAVAIMSTSQVHAPGKHKVGSPRRSPYAARAGSSASAAAAAAATAAGSGGGGGGGLLAASSPASPSALRRTSDGSGASPSPSSSRKRTRLHAEDSLDAWRLKRWRSNSMSDQSEVSEHVAGGGHDFGADGSSGGGGGGRGGGLRPSSPRVAAGAALLAAGPAAGGSGGSGVVPLPINELQDLNPLGPCGACLEWLKKLAEVNPDFRVVMFEDTSCSNVFVRSVFGVNMIR
jgi:cytidine deaminase